MRYHLLRNHVTVVLTDDKVDLLLLHGVRSIAKSGDDLRVVDDQWAEVAYLEADTRLDEDGPFPVIVHVRGQL